MKFRAFIEKSYYQFYKYLIADKNSQCFYKGRIHNPKQVFFYLADKKIVHLGDTLWFEPIAKFLSGHFDVSIYPNPVMEFYFTKLGYKIAREGDIYTQSIVIAPIELMFKLRHLKNVLFLSFDYRSVASGGKLINSMIHAVARHFNLNSDLVDGKYCALEYTSAVIDENFKRFNLQQDEKYIIFNNYIDSWGKHTTLTMVNEYAHKLINYAKNHKAKNKNIKFIYTGSDMDKDRYDTLLDSLIDVDLRGKTTVEDLFLLVGARQIVGYIGFDTFLLHLFNMYDKPSHILLKPGRQDNINQIIEDAVLVPYFSNNYPELILINPNSSGVIHTQSGTHASTVIPVQTGITALKILLIKRAALGDILMATPLIRQLKQKVPNLQLDFLVSDEFAGVLKNNQHIDNLITLPASNFSLKKIFNLLKFAISIRGKYDYVFILDKHYYFNFIGRVISKSTVGFVRETISRLFLRYQIRYDDVMRYHGLYYLDLLKASELASPDYSDYKLDFNISANDVAIAEKILLEYGLIKNEFIIVINSGGNNQFESGGVRMLPENKIVILINGILVAKQGKVVLLGSRNDEINYNNYLKLVNIRNAHSWLDRESRQTATDIINLAGKLSLEQSAALMCYAQKIYTTDCGAMHIAVSTGLFDKLFCFFGPTCPDHVLPPKATDLGIGYYWADMEIFDKRYPLYGKVPKYNRYFTKLNLEKF